MKTQEQIIEAVKNGKKPGCLDARDFGRLIEFFPLEQWPLFGFESKEGAEYKPREWTEENVREQLKEDVSFGFEKALDQRGISSSFMYEVVKMWMWVLDDPLETMEGYAQYGLPLFKAVAMKYDLPNPIGNAAGSEKKYSEYGD